ncbi:glycine--tRNA ligase [Spiroplasma endosymbiont of Amphibalanus improvisus]|uniref:glycine--tRNA ligase n=1 Tax=Spiroplasma endosymbiont of Amphibalanus improvisus TaxID=3066327 RepID=UPI00313AF6F5
MKYKIDDIIQHLKMFGFFFQGSEIYGGLSNTWDYGPLGVELKRLIKDLWWTTFVTRNEYNVGLDSSILLNPKVWEASGHVNNFSDPLTDCNGCKSRYRADQLIEEQKPDFDYSKLSNEQLKEYIDKEKIICPSCKKANFGEIREFDLLFQTQIGVIRDKKSEVYLRPETAQGIFINFKNIQRSMRLKVPFGVCQIGKSFRNEITPGNFIFRTREFEQMEIEFFYKPNDKTDWFQIWKLEIINFLENLGINLENISYLEHDEKKLSHYSKKTLDIEYNFPFGIGELWGLTSRTDFDLKRHQEYSKKSLEYLDPKTNKKYLPYVIEPSVGVDRLIFALLCDAYSVQKLKNNEERTLLKLKPIVAPYQFAILPLSKQLNANAMELWKKLLPKFRCTFDTSGNIGKRYRRQDAIGTPFCITFDFDSLNDKKVTIRDRDSMNQERISIVSLKETLKKLVNN